MLACMYMIGQVERHNASARLDAEIRLLSFFVGDYSATQIMAVKSYLYGYVNLLY